MTRLVGDATILEADGNADDTAAIRAFLRGRAVFHARFQMDIVQERGLADLPPGLYRVRIPHRWPLDPKREGWARRQSTAQDQTSRMGKEEGAT